MGGEFYTSHDPKITSEAGRVCSFPKCSTKLSIYNDEDRCSIHRHAKMHPPKARRGSKR